MYCSFFSFSPNIEINTNLWNENCVATITIKKASCSHGEQSQVNMYLLCKILRVLVLGRIGFRCFYLKLNLLHQKKASIVNLIKTLSYIFFVFIGHLTLHNLSPSIPKDITFLRNHSLMKCVKYHVLTTFKDTWKVMLCWKVPKNRTVLSERWGPQDMALLKTRSPPLGDLISNIALSLVPWLLLTQILNKG